jgi:hypothetical protein
MQAPTEVYSTDLEIKVEWLSLSGLPTGDSAILSYNLYWDNGTGSTDIELTDSLVTEWTVSALQGGENYKFKVRARNIYGYGSWSPEFLVEATDMPGKPPVPVVSLIDTSVHLSWIAPASHFAVIDQYELLWLTVDGTFVQITPECDGTDNLIINALSCDVPMLKVEQETGLATDTLIKVKLRAHNDQGWGGYSELNSIGQVIESLPLKIAQPTINYLEV